ncbi:hypothetical protein V1478_005945 [Vespula squamosa]|uniref:Uncharacterized protein n=1 Tax=Vespula squamosa TaxID=30214 RepID=A0ABD2BAD8_VESSQ
MQEQTTRPGTSKQRQCSRLGHPGVELDSGSINCCVPRLAFSRIAVPRIVLSVYTLSRINLVHDGDGSSSSSSSNSSHSRSSSSSNSNSSNGGGVVGGAGIIHAYVLIVLVTPAQDSSRKRSCASTKSGTYQSGMRHCPETRSCLECKESDHEVLTLCFKHPDVWKFVDLKRSVI